MYRPLNARTMAVSCSSVRFETRGKELLSAARLRKRSRSESEASATAQAAREVGVKAPESLAIDPKPLDLVLSRLNPSERGVEDRIRY